MIDRLARGAIAFTLVAMGRAAIVLALCGCSTTWKLDSSQPNFPFVDSAPATSSLPRLNQNPASSLGIVRGVDGGPWASFTETVTMADGSQQRALRNVQLRGSGSEVLTADHIDRYAYAFYQVMHGTDTTTLTIHSAGQTKDDVFTLDGPRGAMVVGGYDDVFMWWKQDPSTTTFTTQWRTNRYPTQTRMVSAINGADPSDPQATADFRFAFTGTRLYVRDGTGELQWFSTRTSATADLGMVPALWYIDETNHNLLTCGDDGLRQLPLKDPNGYPGITEPMTIDSDPCQAAAGFWFLSNQVIYGVGGVERKASLIGAYAPTEVLDSGLRLIGTLADGRLFYSTDPADRYVNGVGNGWIGDWNFMNRGGVISLSEDESELRWIENAAQDTGIGDLYAAAMPVAPATVGGKAVPLSKNVAEYGGMLDGRLLIEENHAQRGIENRVVVLDERGQYKRWVADQASAFTCIDGACSDLLVDVVTGATGYDIIRVPVPPPLCNRLAAPVADHPDGACDGKTPRCDHLAGEGTWDCVCSAGSWSCTQP
jgi:hypothetical protein